MKSIIFKNIKHNIKQYTSFYLVNLLTTAIVFIYCSFFFSDVLRLNYSEQISIRENLSIQLGILLIFTFVFLIYTYSTLLKKRSKELGLYLSIGLSRRNLVKIILIENISVYLSSFISSVLVGVLFGRLFFMGINKLLIKTEFNFHLTYEAFALTFTVYFLIFIINMFISIRLINKDTIINLLKYSRISEINKSSLTKGFISLILLITSMYFLPKIMYSYENFYLRSIASYILIGFIIITPYFVLGNSLIVFRKVAKRFSKFYNKNLLVLSDLSHRFLDYKNVLYILFLLLTVIISLTALSYSLYNVSIDMTKNLKPYDIMFVESEKYNGFSKKEIENLFENEEAKINDYKTLDFIEVSTFRKTEGGYSFWSDQIVVISESNYNKHLGRNENLNNSILYISVKDENLEYDIPTTIFASLSDSEIKLAKSMYETDTHMLTSDNISRFLADNKANFIIAGNSITEESVPYTNYLKTRAYYSGSAFVVSDEKYNLLRASQYTKEYKYHLINYAGETTAFNELVSYLRTVNNLDSTYWNGVTHGYVDETYREEAESYRPFSLDEAIQEAQNTGSVLIFTMIFMAILLSIATVIVLYYKIVFDLEKERERVSSLIKIGLDIFSIKKTISKQIFIIFMFPIITGNLMSIYLINLITSNMTVRVDIIRESIVAMLIMMGLQVLSVFVVRSKYYKLLSIIT